MVRFDSLELFLSLAQESQVVVLNHLVDSHRLVLQVVEGSSIREKGPLHALLDTRLRALPVRVELSPVLILHVLKMGFVSRLRVDSIQLLIILLLSEFLLSLQLLNSARSSFLLSLQLYYPVLYLSLLVILFLRENDGVHHVICGFLRSNRTHARVKQFMLFFSIEIMALQCRVHGRPRVGRVLHFFHSVNIYII